MTGSMGVKVTMPTLSYDEERLAEALRALPSNARAAFAAACAERLLPAYLLFHERTGRGDPATLTESLASIWAGICGRTPKVSDVNRSAVEGLVPHENDAWVEEAPYAQNAAAAVVYALDTLLTGSVEAVVAAAYQVYEALDHRVGTRDDLDYNVPGSEARVLADPLIQRELARQGQDLEALRDPSTPIEKTAARLRQKALSDGRTLFDGG